MAQRQMVEEGVSGRSAGAGDGTWFCDRGDFWGTSKQLLLCAKCGVAEIKRPDEPRHYAGIFTPRLHMICDECFDTLPDGEPRYAQANKPHSPCHNHGGVR